jgi:hypothetical protein
MWEWSGSGVDVEVTLAELEGVLELLLAVDVPATDSR